MSDGLGILSNLAMIQNVALTTFNAALQEGLSAGADAEDIWTEQVAMVTTSTTETELYEWLGQIQGFRRWDGERHFNPLVENGYALKNVPWESGIEIGRRHFRDNRFLNQAQLFTMMGQNARLHPQQQLALLLAGFATAGAECWDGLPYFHASHYIDPRRPELGTFSNRITNSLTPANLALARAAMVKFKDQSGQKLARPPDTIVCGSDLATTAETIVSSIFVPAIAGAIAQPGQTLVVRQKMRVLECPELDETGVWYLARTKGPIKPMIVQKRTEPVVDWISDLNSEYCKLNAKVRLGADYEAAFGWTFPQYMMRCGDSAAATTLA